MISSQRGLGSTPGSSLFSTCIGQRGHRELLVQPTPRTRQEKEVTQADSMLCAMVGTSCPDSPQEQLGEEDGGPSSPVNRVCEMDTQQRGSRAKISTPVNSYIQGNRTDLVLQPHDLHSLMHKKPTLGETDFFGGEGVGLGFKLRA